MLVSAYRYRGNTVQQLKPQHQLGEQIGDLIVFQASESRPIPCNMHGYECLDICQVVENEKKVHISSVHISATFILIHVTCALSVAVFSNRCFSTPDVA